MVFGSEHHAPAETTTGLAHAAKPLVVLVEDDPALLTMLRYSLERTGYRGEEAVNGREALMRIAELWPDIVPLDRILPALSGVRICRQLRRQFAMRDIAMIMLPAHAKNYDAVYGLDGCTDDDVPGPFDPETLLARIRSRLWPAGTIGERTILTFYALGMDVVARRVRRNGRRVHRAPVEFRMMDFLVRQPKRVVDRGEICHAVWGADAHVEGRTVDGHLRRLRGRSIARVRSTRFERSEPPVTHLTPTRSE